MKIAPPIKLRLRSPATAFGAGRSLSWLLEARVRDRPNHIFFVWEPFEGAAETWTYARFSSEVARVAHGMRRRGIGHGDPVVIHLDNRPEFLLCWFACAHLGAVAVSTNTRSSPDEMRYFARHCGAQLFITQRSLAALVAEAAPSGADLVVVDDPQSGHGFAELISDVAEPVHPVDALDPLSIQYTSGTTGRPKAVIWTHANALWGGKMNAMHEGLTERDISLVFPPLFHTNAQAYLVLSTLWAGATFILQPKFSVSRFWDVSLRNRCTFASQLYFSLRALSTVEAPKRHHYRLWGTGICDHPIAANFGVPTIGWWGMTETISHPIIGDCTVPNRAQTIGRAATGYEVAVMQETGAPAKAGETGDLFVRGIAGISLFAGYLHDPDATANAFDADGWFATGDRITVTDEGSMIFADRKKDMLKVGAENVAASEIERVIAGIKGVREVAVVGKPDAMLDEVPVAFVVAEAGEDDLERLILAECGQKLADFKIPREVRFLDDMPRSTLEKIAKQKLRETLLCE